MTFQTEFMGPFQTEIEIKVVRRSKAVKIAVAKRAFKLINAKWPTNTGWSKFNNRISINFEDFDVSPSKRPSKEGALVDSSINENARELAKLNIDTIKANDTIFIGNAVPYAADVGFSLGQGLNIYAESLREAGAGFRGR